LERRSLRLGRGAGPSGCRDEQETDDRNASDGPEPNRVISAGWTGLEPAASGVTGAHPEIAAGSSALQPAENVPMGAASQAQGLSQNASVFENLLTTSSQGFLTVGEVAKRLGVCRSTVYQLCERGELRHVRVSNAIRVPSMAIMAYLRR
jgi:excisionase family DNA binding protein